MYKFLTKNGQLFSFSLGLAITAIFFLIAINGMERFNAMPKEEQFTTTIFNFGLVGALALVALAAVATIVFAAVQMAGNLRNSLWGIVGALAIVGIFFVSYAMADGEATGAIKRAADNAGGVSANNLKIIGGAITTSLILLAAATLTFVVSEIRNIFK